jgi:anaerobic selenocysteine-containing dehydrogenase
LTGPRSAHGSEAVWPYYYAGTMGLVQRDGIHRLRHACAIRARARRSASRSPMPAGWPGSASRGARRREMAEADLIVIWGGNPVTPRST